MTKIDEFDLIKNYFQQPTISRSDVLLGIGDDGALLKTNADNLLVVAIDTFVEGTHFLKETPAYEIGYKSLAINLSDLAAMGAEPAWMTLALTLPKVHKKWLEKFSEGLFFLANLFNVQLIGGDTTRGPLAITIQAHGFVPTKKALCRHTARVGDKIFVSGTLGDAGLGLRLALGKTKLPEQFAPYVLQRFHRPIPQIKLGILLRDFASSAIDISDGLLADLNHILTASKLGAEIWVEQLPISDALRVNIRSQEAIKLALTAGEDYELCFTVPPQKEDSLMAALQKEQMHCTCIGKITAKAGIKLHGYQGKLPALGYKHF